MKLKNNYHLSLKTLIGLIIIAAFLGGGFLYSALKAVTWTTTHYQQWQARKHPNPLSAITDFFKKEVPQNIQPIKIIDEQSQVIEVVKKASPAVVSIVASAQVPTFENYFDTPTGIPEEFGQFFSVPQQRQNGTQEQKIGAGTGFLVSADGYIVTNKHVVNAKEADYTVYLNNESDRGEKIKARVVALDPNNDLAILKIEKK